MPSVRWCLLVGAVALGWSAPVSAQSAPVAKMQATITLANSETRSGPGLGMAMTGRMNAGEQVWIVSQEGDWFGILPPAGSRSWIHPRYLGRIDPANKADKFNIVVESDCPREWVRIGADGKNIPTEVNSVRLPRGTIVEVVGSKVVHQNTTWYPITPPAGELRWISKYNVSTPRPSTSPPTTNPPRGAPAIGELVSRESGNANAAPAEKNEVDHRLWPTANRAFYAGDYREAEKMYKQILVDLNQSNAPVNHLLLVENRLDVCRAKMGTTGSVAVQPVSTGPKGRNQEGDPIRQVGDKQNDNAQSSGAVRIRRSGLFVDNRVTYALENGKGELMYYANVDPATDVNLETYVNGRNLIEVVGSVRNRGDVRGVPFMTVSSVRAR